MSSKDFNFATCMTDGGLDWAPGEREAIDARVAQNHEIQAAMDELSVRATREERHALLVNILGSEEAVRARYERNMAGLRIACTPVEPGCECPDCGENREDCLVWGNGWVVCSTCGWVYKP